MSARPPLVRYAGWALGVAATGVAVGHLVVWGAMQAFGLKVSDEVSAADLLSATVAFSSLVATLVLAYIVSTLSEEQSRRDAAHRAEKGFALRHADEVLERLAHLLALLRRTPSVSYTDVVAVVDELGERIDALQKVVGLLGHTKIEAELDALLTGKGNALDALRRAAAPHDSVAQPSLPMGERDRQRALQFARELAVHVRRLYVEVNRA